MDEIKYLGIDFGSIYTYICGMEENKQTVFSLLPDEYLTDGYPTSKGLKLGWLTCIDSETKDNENPQKQIEVFFRNVLSVSLDEKQYRKDNSESKLTESLERHYNIDSVKTVVIGGVLLYSQKKLNNLIAPILNAINYYRRADNKLERKNITVLPEPILASVAYDKLHPEKKSNSEDELCLPRNKWVMVVDLGGTTGDVGVIKKTRDNFIQYVGMIKSNLVEGTRINKAIKVSILAADKGLANIDLDKAVEEAKRKLFKDNKGIFALVSIKQNEETIVYLLTECPHGNKDETIAWINETCRTKQLNPSINKVDITNVISISEIQYWKNLCDISYNSVKEAAGKIVGQLDDKITKILFSGGISNVEPLRELVIKAVKDHLADGFAQEKDVLLMLDDKRDSDQVKPYTANAVAYGAALCAANVYSLEKLGGMDDYFTIENKVYEGLSKLNQKKEDLELIESIMKELKRQNQTSSPKEALSDTVKQLNTSGINSRAVNEHHKK